MTLGSLFDGISGFPLAASWAGIETKWVSEIDPFCLKVSKKNFPNAKQYGDIKEIGGGRKWQPESVDIIAGGDPCQPHSVAGSQKGKEDQRYLWPEKFRIIQELQPKWVINENVHGSVTNGVLDQKICDLEGAKYTCLPPLSIAATSAGAYHRRKRIWLIAYSCTLASSQTFKEALQNRENRATWNNDSGISWGQIPGFGGSILTPRVLRNNDGVPNRVDRCKALGNSIVPHIAFQIFKAIQEVDSQ